MEGSFFGDSWIGKEVEFSNPEASKWRIKEKTSEKVEQFDSLDLRTLGGPILSYSWAIFLCEEVNDNDEDGSHNVAFMKVYRQIPHVGTMGEPHTIRAQQAGTRPFCDIEAYKYFARQQARHLPVCLAHKYERQDEYDLVPGGFMYYVVYTKVPGLRLDDKSFWALEDDERDTVRKGFVEAYNEMWSAGLYPWMPGVQNLVWDRETDTVYIVDFRITHEMPPKSEWNDFIFAAWRLAIPPKGTKGPRHGVTVPDTTDWKF